jgi:3-phosphoshikimate 1-carboxyvinyltransferase
VSEEVIEIQPLRVPPAATIRVPGSKSISNRALLVAALAEGESTLSGALFSDDTRYMAQALTSLGFGVEVSEPEARLRVMGLGGRIPASAADLHVGNAGTAMRFLVAALCLGRGRFRIDGSPRMRSRPIGDLVDALAQLGGHLSYEMQPGCPPVVVDANGLAGGEASLPGDKSSQFLSAVLQVGAYAERDVHVVVPGTLIAKPYVDMTLAVMHAFGVEVERDAYRAFTVRAGQRFRGRAYRIEPDASAAHYFLAAAAVTGGRVRIEGLGRSSVQGDIRFADILEEMGARVTWEDDAVEVVGPDRLRGVDVDMNAISDTAPTLAAIAPFAAGAVRIRNIGHVRWQESDRIHAVATELRRLGVRVEELPDGLEVHPSAIIPAAVETYDDHRIAMSFALIGLRVSGIVIRDPGCTAKTFPDYFERLEGLRR